MPLAQSSELPPPSPMIESMPSGAANARPASTIAESGFSPKSWNGMAATPAASRRVEPPQAT